jgi:uncharacterized membrane protein (DUF106 family)
MVETLTNFLLAAADAVLTTWDGVSASLASVFAGINGIVGPVLAWALGLLNPIATVAGDLTYGCLNVFPPWVGITFISALTGVVMLLAFRYTSNQTAITQTKDDIKAHLLALKLFKEDLRTVVLSQLRLVWSILKLQRYVLTPVLIASPPMLLLLAQMGVRYQWRPVPVGESVVLTMLIDEEVVDGAAVALEAPAGVTVEAGSVPGGGSVSWRVSSATEGRYELTFDLGETTVTKELVVGDSLARVSAMRPSASWIDRLLHPVERPLPSTSGIRSIELAYPSVTSYVCGADWWVLYFFVVSMVVALVFKPVFNVKF